MISHNKLCKCKNPVEFVCLDHSTYICKQETAHKNCSIAKFSVYEKTVRTLKKEFLQKLKTLKEENLKNYYTVLEKNKQPFKDLQKLKRQIQNNLDALTLSYQRIVKESFNDQFKTRVREIEKQLNNWESDNDFIKIDQHIQNENYGKLRKKERRKFERIKSFQDKNPYFGEVFTFLKNIDKNVKSCLSSFKKNKLDNLKIINYNKEKKFGEFDKKYKTQDNFLNNHSSKFNSYIRVKERRKSVVPEKDVGVVEYFTNNKSDFKYYDIDQFTSQKPDKRISTPLRRDIDDFSKENAFAFDKNIKISEISQSIGPKEDRANGLGDSILIKEVNDAGQISDKLMTSSYVIENEDYNRVEGKFENQLEDNKLKLTNSLLDVIEELKKKINNPIYFNTYNDKIIKEEAQQFVEDVRNIFEDIFSTWKK